MDVVVVIPTLRWGQRQQHLPETHDSASLLHSGRNKRACASTWLPIAVL